MIAEAAARPATARHVGSSLWVDRVWAVVALALAGLVISAERAETDPWPRVAVLLGSAGVFAGARLVLAGGRRLVTGIVVAVAAILLLRSPASVMSAVPRSGPFGYSSITGAFFAQAAIAALMLATSRPLTVRFAGIVAAGMFGWVTVTTQARTAAILVALMAVVSLAAFALGSARRALGAFGVVVALAVSATVALGATFEPHRSTVEARAVHATVTERRQALWHDAHVLAARNPVFGIGPGRFALESPVARSDQDEPWAHEEFLQASAESGLAAGPLLAAVFGLGFARLAVRPKVDAIAVLGAASLAVLGVHACIEYVLQRPAVPLAAAALVGVGIGPFEFRKRTRGRHARA